MLREGTCPLCENENAKLGPAIVPGGGVRAGRLAVICPECRGFLIEDSLVKSGSVSVELRMKLSRISKEKYRDDGSDRLEITEDKLYKYL